jgi:hypothetical protein
MHHTASASCKVGASLAFAEANCGTPGAAVGLLEGSDQGSEQSFFALGVIRLRGILSRIKGNGRERKKVVS